MQTPKFSSSVIAKTLLATVLLAALAAVAGSQLAPNVPLHTVLLYSVLGAVALFGMLVAATVVTLTLRQFILRKGGTDTQWFWFSGEPRGLEQLREQSAIESRQPKH